MSDGTTRSSRYLSGINALRGCLALSVLLWHYQHLWLSNESFDYVQQPLFSVLRIPYTRGYEAVQIFWMVSGVVLAHTYFQHLDRADIKSYVAARAARLYPLHILTLGTVLILQLLGSASQIYGNNDLKHLLLNIFFIPWWGFEDGYSFNAPIWSVSIEIPIYALFALLILRSSSRLRIWAVAAATMALTFAAMNDYGVMQVIGVKSDFARCALFFLVGVLISQVIGMHIYRHSMIWLCTCIAALLALASNPSNLLMVTGAVLCVLALSIDQSIPLVHSRTVRLFGELTYSVFLWHVPMQIIIRWILLKLEVNNDWFDSPYLLFTYLAITYVVGYVSYRFFEEPARRMIRGWFAKRAVNQAT